MALMKDVANRAGVSISTVSFVLNGTAKQHKVADSTAMKVRKAARELGYRINSSIDSTPDAFLKKKVIGVFFPEGTNSTDLGMITDNIYQYLGLQKLSCNLMIIPYCNNKICNTIETTDWNMVDAAIVIISHPDEIQDLNDLPDNLPLVFFNYSDSRYNSVSCDTQDSYSKLCDVIRIKGYQDITVITSDTSLRICDPYFSQFLALCEQAGISISAENYVTVENSFYGGAIAARKILNSKQRPSLILSMNTILSRGAIPVFARNNFYIPHHSELASFGLDSDLSYLQNHIPSLTMIVFPVMEMSKIAIDMAFQLIDNPERQPIHRICHCELGLNESLSL